MSYLVTGGAGFIGSNLVQTLLDQGRDVVCLDKNAHGTWRDGAWNYVGSVNNLRLVEDLVERYDVDTIFHMAAEASIQKCIEDPVNTMKQNVLGTNKILQTAKEFGINRVLFSSTSAVYECNHLIQSETSSLNPTLNPYALSKYFGEQLCATYSDCININILRYFNVYGEGHRTDGAYPPVVAIFMDRFKNNLPLEIVGTGHQKRDFINVSDVVRANIMMADSDINGGIYNVGSGVNHSVKELADMISENQIHIEQRKGEVTCTLANINKIETELNWFPETSVGDWIKNELEMIDG